MKSPMPHGRCGGLARARGEKGKASRARGGNVGFFVDLCFRRQNKLLTLWWNFVFFVFVVPAVMRRFGRKCSCDGEETGEEHKHLLNTDY